MAEMTKFIVPPMCPDRVICQWSFEGGGFVAVVSFGGPDTTEKLDAIQRMIDLKREEIAKSAPDFKAAQNIAESDPVATPDCSGADTLGGELTQDQVAYCRERAEERRKLWAEHAAVSRGDL